MPRWTESRYEWVHLQMPQLPLNLYRRTLAPTAPPFDTLEDLPRPPREMAWYQNVPVLGNVSSTTTRPGSREQQASPNRVRMPWNLVAVQMGPSDTFSMSVPERESLSRAPRRSSSSSRERPGLSEVPYCRRRARLTTNFSLEWPWVLFG